VQERYKDKYKGLPSKFFPLLKFDECRKWIEDCFLSLRSRRTVRDYAEALVQFIEFSRRNPKTLCKLTYEEAIELMRKFVFWRVRELGISAKRARAQWFALASFFKFHGVKGGLSFSI